jgi:mRNA interferase MazF
MMKIKKMDIWLADLNPRFGTEAGKTRPVLVVQTDLLNKIHPSTIVCPITSNVKPDSQILRVHIRRGESGMKTNCDVMIDQLRAIDNKRLVKRVGAISPTLASKVRENIRIVLDLD